MAYPVMISDTAGIRNSKDEIEKKGINLAFKEAENADLNNNCYRAKKLILLTFLAIFQKKKSILVINKIDLGINQISNEITKYDPIYISIKDEKNLDKLIKFD